MSLEIEYYADDSRKWLEIRFDKRSVFNIEVDDAGIEFCTNDEAGRYSCLLIDIEDAPEAILAIQEFLKRL